MGFEVYDIETLSNLFTYTGYDYMNKKWYQFVICKWRNDFNELVEHLFQMVNNKYIQIGFNNENFDYPVIHHILNHHEEYSNLSGQEIAQHLYDKAQDLINNTNEDGKQFNTIADKNKFIRQIDLYKVWHYNNNARRTSLKDLEVCMNMPNVEEMPIDHHSWCKEGDEKLVLAYNKNDVEATVLFFEITLGKTNYSLYKDKNKLQLRSQLQSQYQIPCLNYPDVKIGEELILSLYCRKTGKNMYELKKSGGTPRSSINLANCIPPWANFKSKEFNELKRKFQNTVITNSKGEFSESVIYHGIKINYGTGGAHSATYPGVYESDDYWIIVDQDVGSLYPSIAIQLGLYPEHLGPEFLEIYDKDIVSVRLAEKIKPKKERDMVIMDGFKLSANGIYGKSGEETSALYDPLYTMRTTIGGQLFLSLWTEKLVEAIPEIKFIQHNTDGITYMVPRKDLETVSKISKEMTELTGLYIEDNFYSKFVLRDVNNYLSVYENGDFKAKGAFEIDKEYHKDPSMKIVPIAIKEYYINNIPVEQTIRNHTNIYDFCLRLKVNSAATGKFTHFNDEGKVVTDDLSRTTRYYIGRGLKSGSITKAFHDGRISAVNKGFSGILFNRFEEKPMSEYKIDYSFYIAEANKIINAVDDGQLSLF